MLRGDNSERYGWLIGGGLISLSAAVYMIRDGNMKGENIHIFEEVSRTSWTNDLPVNESLFKEPLTDYKFYSGLMDLLSEIPSVTHPKLSVEKDLTDFNQKIGELLKTGNPENRQRILNQYHTVLLSLREWLKSEGCVFFVDTSVKKLEFKKYADTDEKVISSIFYRQDSEDEEIETGFEDIVLIGTEYNAEKIPEKCHNLIYFSDYPSNYELEETVLKSREKVYEFLGLED